MDGMGINRGIYGDPYANTMGTGYQYTGQAFGNTAQQAKIKNALTGDEIKKLLQKKNVFSLAITETERLQAICTHRFENGQDALQDTGENGMVRCQICGHIFSPMDVSTTIDTIRQIVAETVDVIQTIKLVYLDIPTDVAREYFVVIALLNKLPELFEYACKDWVKHERFTYGAYNNRNANYLNLLNMIVGGMDPVQANMYRDQGMQQGFDPNGMAAWGNPAYRHMNGQPMMPGGPGFGSTIFGTPQGAGMQNMGNYQYGAVGDQVQQPDKDKSGVTTDGVTEVTNTFRA